MAVTTCIVAFTPLASSPLIRLPVLNVTITEGIVMVGSAPPMVPNAPAALLATITDVAPAFWAFFTFTTKPQVPRSTRAILPAIAPALVKGEQASVVVGDPGTAGSSACTTLPVIPAGGTGEPNSAPA